MARLPVPGADRGTWGDILNEFLSVSHEADGTLKSSAAVKTSGDQTVAGVKTFSSSPIVPTPTSPTDAATKQYVDDTALAGAPDADAVTKGIVQLAGDLSGTAASPQIAAGAIVNADVNAAAAIAQSKIANLTTDLAGKASTSHSHTAADVTDFDTEVSNNIDVAANTAARHTHANSSVLDATTASFTLADETKLDGIEAAADVTDATNVDAAGAVMNTDTSTVAMQFVVDEDDMISNSATKVPTQQSTKTYIDDEIVALDQLAAGVKTDLNTGTPGIVAVDVDLSEGKAGGDTLVGGTAAGDDLTLASTEHATRGIINLRDGVSIISEDKTHTDLVNGFHAFDWASGRTLTFSSGILSDPGNTFTYISFAPTVVWGVDSYVLGGGSLLSNSGVFKNAPGVATSHYGFYTLADVAVSRADGATFTQSGWISALLTPGFQTINGGTMTVTGVTGISMGTTVGSGATVTTRRGVLYSDATGAGAVTTQVGIDVTALSKATTNIGIRNAATTVITPSVATLAAAGNSITPDASLKRLNNTSGGSLTLTSAPTIANGQDGQRLLLLNTSANNVVLQDQGTLASSNLRLSAATITLGTRDSIELVYSSDVGDWVQISQVNVL